MDTLGIEPNTSRMLSERDNQLHHVPDRSEVAGCRREGQPFEILILNSGIGLIEP